MEIKALDDDYILMNAIKVLEWEKGCSNGIMGEFCDSRELKLINNYISGNYRTGDNILKIDSILFDSIPKFESYNSIFWGRAVKILIDSGDVYFTEYDFSTSQFKKTSMPINPIPDHLTDYLTKWNYSKVHDVDSSSKKVIFQISTNYTLENSPIQRFYNYYTYDPLGNTVSEIVPENFFGIDSTSFQLMFYHNGIIHGVHTNPTGVFVVDEEQRTELKIFGFEACSLFKKDNYIIWSENSKCEYNYFQIDINELLILDTLNVATFPWNHFDYLSDIVNCDSENVNFKDKDRSIIREMPLD